MDNIRLPSIKNIDELKALFNQYKNFLSPENAATISSLIQEIEKGPHKMDTNQMKNLTSKLQNNADREKNNL
ncbi:MAG: hypothetical protein ACOX05_04825 [Bacillota bacterium]|jgi:hypothetical protein